MGGIETAWRESGEGEPLVLLHGVPTSSLLFRDAMPLLPGRVLAPDLPGYGESANPEQVDLDATLDWAEAWLDHLGLGVVDAAGQDFGGLVAAGLAHRGRVRRLALTSTALSWGWTTSVVAALPPLDRIFYRLFAGRAYLARAERGPVLTALHVGRIASDPDFAARMRRTALALRGIAPPRVPTICVWGSHDPLFPPWMGRRTAASIGAEWVLIEDGRHTLPFDRPRSWAGVISEFLQRGAD